MLFDLKSYRQALYPLWKQRRLLRGNEPLPTPEPKPEITAYELKADYLKWLAFWLCIVFALCYGASVAHAEDINLDIIADIESSSEPLAYNRETGATGMYQITLPVIIDFNNEMEEAGIMKGYNLDDMYTPERGKFIAQWYINNKIPSELQIYNIPDTITSRLIAWNWGIGHLRKWFKHGSHWNKLPLETRKYVKKYFKEINQ